MIGPALLGVYAILGTKRRKADDESADLTRKE
jgi:hypothetical protein